MKRKTILLTGIAGFIGAHTLEHIMEHTDYHVIGWDSLAHAGNIKRIEQVLYKNSSWKKRLTFVKQDIALSSFYKLASSLNGELPEIIINMASESHVDRSISDPQPFIKNNVDLTVNMLELARMLKPEIFIQISTDEVYGPMHDHPYKEWERYLPSNPYSASKAAQEMIAISYWRTYGVPLVITNTMNNYGQLQDVEKFVPMLIRDISEGNVAQIHGTDEEIGTRFYLHARNHADALLFIMKQGAPKNYESGNEFPDKYNIVGDTQLSNLEMAEAIAKLLKKPLKYELVDYHSTRPGHDMHYGLDGSKLYNMGWRSPLNFQESMLATVEDYLQHPEWMRG